jgi:REP element-mobilizing transposase RayT
MHTHEPALKARFIQKPSSDIAVFGYRSAMPQSLSKVVIHIIFSTKDRHPWLDAGVRPRMHAYLATICRDAGAEAFRVGGAADHVHLVTTLPRTLSQVESRFQRSLRGGQYFWGIAPGCNEAAPLALNRYHLSRVWCPASRRIRKEFAEANAFPAISQRRRCSPAA